jgi:hypothetical protein
MLFQKLNDPQTPLRESLPRFGGGFRERQKGAGVKMTKKKINIL